MAQDVEGASGAGTQVLGVEFCANASILKVSDTEKRINCPWILFISSLKSTCAGNPLIVGKLMWPDLD